MNVICFGEILFRFAPDGDANWLKEKTMPAFVAGAELNVAQALTLWHQPTSYISALPDSFISRTLLAHLEGLGIDCSKCKLGGARMGIYYLAMGTDLKSAGVIYDRAGSSFSTLELEDIDWGTVLEGADWLHISAISPALNHNVALVCIEAVKKAKAKGINVSIDLNYRNKLWQYGIEPTRVMPDIVKHCNVIMGNLWAVESLLGIPSGVGSSQGKSDAELQEAAEEQISALKATYKQIEHVAYTFRLDDSYWCLINSEEVFVRSKKFMLPVIVDKVGSGDCFMAAIIYGLRQAWAAETIANFASSAAVGKLQEKGDATSQTVETIHARII